VGKDHASACYHHESVERMRKEAKNRETWKQAGSDDASARGVGDD